MYTNVYSSSIHNHKKTGNNSSPELTEYDISIPRNTISNKKKQIINSHNLDESQRHSAELKKPVLKGHILCDSM